MTSSAQRKRTKSTDQTELLGVKIKAEAGDKVQLKGGRQGMNIGPKGHREKDQQKGSFPIQWEWESATGETAQLH